MSRPITLRHGPLGRSRRRSRRASRLFLAAIVAGLWLAFYASAFRCMLIRLTHTVPKTH